MTGIALILFGAVLVVTGIGIACNTSMGGTRSDHSDNSGIIAFAGSLAIVVGLIVLMVEALT